MPANYDLEQVNRLIYLMTKVTSASYVGDLLPTEDTHVDLHFHSAAEYLGMGSFTQNIFDLYFKRVINTVPTVTDVEAIGSVRTPPGDKIYKQMAYNTGIKYYENKIANRADFERYLRGSYKQMSQAALQEREAKRAAKAKPDAHIEHELEQRAWKFQSQKQEKQDKLEQRKKKGAEVKASMLEKRRLGQKLNAEEARAYEKLYGRRVLVKVY
ncbi:hypothetical protein EK21DRAFT_117297 [Setomelanomma holmii]|uniref:Uncharacterized protein n=1 Tax=Setomelanomma holmii TaxID=210430 RepID=A0A9P4GZR4_9PLEO|nr:hypothetical protein EK21DRAFT_117297 [Setomelanomma holmii]